MLTNISLKKLSHIALILLAATSLVYGQNKQVDWIQNLGGSEREEATCIQPTSDGGLIISGYTYSNDGLLSNNKGWQDGWLIKTNSEGHLEWQKNIGADGADVIEEVTEVEDGYIICGWSSSTNSAFVNSNGLEDGFIAKVDQSGEIIWKNSYGGTLMDKLFDLEILDNGDIVAVGYLMSEEVVLTNSSHHGLLDIWVIRLNAAGELIWQNCYGGSDEDFAYNITKTDDNKLIIAGSTDSMDGQVGATVGEWDCWLIQIDTNGDLEWSTKYGYEMNETINDLIVYNDHYYIIGSSNSPSRSDAHGSHDAWVAQFNKNGHFINDYSFGSSSKESVKSAFASSEGIFITGESELNGSKDGWIIQIDGNGSILYSQFIGGSDYDILNDISIRDNEIYVVGSSYSSDGDVIQNFGESDVLVAKLGNGSVNTPVEITVFPNPATDHLTIVLDEIGIEQIDIYNSLGQLVTSISGNDFFQEQLNIQDWDAGVYTINVLSNEEVIQQQFIKL